MVSFSLNSCIFNPSARKSLILGKYKYPDGPISKTPLRSLIFKNSIYIESPGPKM